MSEATIGDSSVPKQVPDSWDSFAVSYDAREGDTGDEFRQRLYDPAVESMIGDVVGATVLDAGCGNGYWAKKLVGLGAAKVIGVDSSEKLIDIARKRTEGLPVELHVADLSEDLPLESESCDLAVANMVLDYVDNLDKFISEAHRVLKPNGKIVIGIQNPYYNMIDFNMNREKYGEPIETNFGFKVPKLSFEGQAEVPVYARQLSNDYIDPMLKKGFKFEKAKEIWNTKDGKAVTHDNVNMDHPIEGPVIGMGIPEEESRVMLYEFSKEAA